MSDADIAEVEAAAEEWAAGSAYGAKMAASAYSAALVYSKPLAELYKPKVDTSVQEELVARKKALIAQIID